MNSYYKYCDEESIICFLELDEELYCLRAVYEVDGQYVNTFLTIADRNYFLPEGSFIDSLDFITEIFENEFSQIWTKSKLTHLKFWEEFKLNKNLNDGVTGEILCFYPQGVIVDIGEVFYGIANYEECLQILGQDKMYPKQKLDLSIVEFDSLNMLVKLK